MANRVLVHEVTLDGYKATADSKTLDFGTWGSYGIEKLHLTLGQAWEGLVITAHFNVKGSVAATAVADVDMMMDVPWEATKENTFAGRIVFEGNMNGQRRLTANLNFKVTNHGEYKGSDPEPTDDKWNQFVTETKGYREDALDAAQRAQKTEVDVGTLGDEKKQAIISESEKQQKAVADKGAATLATIPEDYTAMGLDVDALTDALTETGFVDVSQATWKYGALTISGGVTGTSQTVSIYADIGGLLSSCRIKNTRQDLVTMNYVGFDADGAAIGERKELTELVAGSIVRIRIAIKRVDGSTIASAADVYRYLLILYRSAAVAKTVNGIAPVNGDVELDAEAIPIEEAEEVTAWANGYIATNVAAGAVVDVTPVASASWQHTVLPVQAGDAYIITATGGTAPKAWAFTDAEYKLLKKADGAADGETITADADGYLIVNQLLAQAHKLEFIKKVPVKEALYAVDARVAALEEAGQEPLVKFEFGHSLRDVSADLEKINYNDSTTVPGTVCALFDALAEEFPEYVTKFDLAEHLGIAYPAYANGVAGSDTYLDTPAYKVNCYKFSCSNAGAGNGALNKKKKLLLISGVHGSENAAPFNAYLFAKNLCEMADANAFKMRAAFDIWVVPYVNWYSGYHKDVAAAQRVNANGVNINRNFPIKGWTLSGEGTKNYTGPSAGSEFETQLIMGITNEIKPDMCVDHHNYMFEDQQFYTDVAAERAIRPAHQALVDCSFAFIKGLPGYFGSKFQLFTPDRDISSAPNKVSRSPGTTCVWWGEQGIGMPVLIEICDRIRFVNGEADSTHLANGVFTAEAFSVADFTLRNQVYHFAQSVLDGE